MVDEATSRVELGALSVGESRRVSACLIQRGLTKVALKSSEAFKDNCYFRDWSGKKKGSGSLWVQPCPLSEWWLNQRQIKRCNNQVCHASLQRQRDDPAPLHLSRIKSVMCHKWEESRPLESTEWADFFPDERPKMTRPGFVLYHLRHLIQIWVTWRDGPPHHQSPVIGPSQAGPRGPRPGHRGPTNRHGAWILLPRGQCQDSSGSNNPQMAPSTWGIILGSAVKVNFLVKVKQIMHKFSFFFLWKVNHESSLCNLSLYILPDARKSCCQSEHLWFTC